MKYELVIDNKFPELDEKEKQLKELINGRKPRNEYEKNLIKQLEKMKKEGMIPYIPSN
jgi:hypothetical protein